MDDNWMTPTLSVAPMMDWTPTLFNPLNRAERVVSRWPSGSNDAPEVRNGTVDYVCW